MDASTSVFGELSVDAWLPADSDIMCGEVKLKFQDRREVKLSFRGRDVGEGGDNFLIEVFLEPVHFKLVSFCGLMTEADWDRQSKGTIGLLGLLDQPLSEAEAFLRSASLEQKVLAAAVPKDQPLSILAKTVTLHRSEVILLVQMWQLVYSHSISRCRGCYEKIDAGASNWFRTDGRASGEDIRAREGSGRVCAVGIREALG